MNKKVNEENLHVKITNFKKFLEGDKVAAASDNKSITRSNSKIKIPNIFQPSNETPVDTNNKKIKFVGKTSDTFGSTGYLSQKSRASDVAKISSKSLVNLTNNTDNRRLPSKAIRDEPSKVEWTAKEEKTQEAVAEDVPIKKSLRTLGYKSMENLNTKVFDKIDEHPVTDKDNNKLDKRRSRGIDRRRTDSMNSILSQIILNEEENDIEFRRNNDEQSVNKAHEKEKMNDNTTKEAGEMTFRKKLKEIKANRKSQSLTSPISLTFNFTDSNTIVSNTNSDAMKDIITKEGESKGNANDIKYFENSKSPEFVPKVCDTYVKNEKDNKKDENIKQNRIIQNDNTPVIDSIVHDKILKNVNVPKIIEQNNSQRDNVMDNGSMSSPKVAPRYQIIQEDFLKKMQAKKGHDDEPIYENIEVFNIQPIINRRKYNVPVGKPPVPAKRTSFINY